MTWLFVTCPHTPTRATSPGRTLRPPFRQVSAPARPRADPRVPAVPVRRKATRARLVGIAVSALRFLYRVAVGKDWDIPEVLPAPKQPRNPPVVPSPGETGHFLGCVASNRHRAILTCCYAAGLRISEAISLRPADIDSRRMVVRIERGKGRKDGFFLPVRVLSRRFRTLFLRGLVRAFRQGSLRLDSSLAPLAEAAAFDRYLQPVRQADCVVYCKPPFDGPARVHLGRYTHRVAISNDRLLATDNGHVRFRWKDDRQTHRRKTMSLPAEEFVRRFLLHVLPRDFHRIRHCGFLDSRHCAAKLALCGRLLDMPPTEPASDPPPDYRDRFEQLAGESLRQCPACRHGRTLCVETFQPGAQRPEPADTS